jgi:hypothetical protein
MEVQDAVLSFTQESRTDGDYLVPCVTVLVGYTLGNRETLSREEHLSLDADSRTYRAVDPWLASQ